MIANKFWSFSDIISESTDYVWVKLVSIFIIIWALATNQTFMNNDELAYIWYNPINTNMLLAA